MCTVSLIPVEGGYRLLHSRDELRARSPGAPPSELAVGDRRAIAPRDPDAGGTWLALRCDGATFAITNVNPEPAPSKPHAPISRGSLVDGMLALEPEPGAVGPWVRSRDLMRLACFRAILVEPAGRAWSWVWDGASLAEETTGEMG
ncbi:MAG: NRDE family protein, partial [Planctomycetota bacterium]